MEEKVIGEHKVIFNGRSDGSITGIRDVLSFDANEIILDTNMGMLMIKGAELHVTSLTLEKGEVKIGGRIDSFVYSEPHSGKNQGNGFFSRMFQ